MSTLFPDAAQRRVAPPTASPETVDTARRSVRELLEASESFGALPPDERREMANNLVKISTYLAEPDGIRVPPRAMSADVRALATPVGARRAVQSGQNVADDGKFTAQAAREGAAVAGALLDSVNFVEFVSGLIDGVFHSIIDASIRQMEATAKLVADVAKTLNQFRDDNTTANQGRDHLVEQFPDLFKLALPSDDFSFGNDDEDGGGRPREPRVSLREGVDEQAAVQRLNQSLPLQQPITRLDDGLIEALLVPAARTQIATGRQQLLATLVTLGINRIVVTDGKISAKVMYEFKARDNMKFRRSAQQFDYSDKMSRTWSGENETDIQGGSSSRSRGADGATSSERTDGSYYSKGTYNNTERPLLSMQSATSTALDANLETKAKLAGEVHVNFKSDYLPLDKVANPAMMAQLQMNAQPGMLENLAKNRPNVPGGAPGATAPATSPAPAPAA